MTLCIESGNCLIHNGPIKTSLITNEYIHTCNKYRSKPYIINLNTFRYITLYIVCNLTTLVNNYVKPVLQKPNYACKQLRKTCIAKT